MCCITLIAQDVTMATTQFMRAACEVCWPRREQARTEHRPPRMNWVVVTDESRNRRMQMKWAPAADTR